MPRVVLMLAAVLLLTALTEVGGVVLLLAIGIARLLRWRRFAAAGLFLIAYAVTSAFVVPPLAALAGRVPLSCTGQPLRALPILCALNRHYLEPKLLTLATALASDLATSFPGAVTVALDANFPFFDGVPLLPHLSHDDGRKLDLSYFYANPSGAYQPAATRSPVGYWAFETPASGEATPCPDEWLTTRWDITWLQPLWSNLQLEPERTRYALNWLFDQGPS